jgi:hypothetical protein
MEIAPNMVLAPPVVSGAFHSASPVYSQVEESSASTPTSSTNRFDINKGSDTELTIKDLPVEYRQKLEAICMKMEEAFMAPYDVTSQDWFYEIHSRLPLAYTKRWLRRKLKPNKTIVWMTFKVVIAYLSCQEMDRLASWGRILLQIPRSSQKTRMICITQKQVQPRIIKRNQLVMGLL